MTSDNSKKRKTELMEASLSKDEKDREVQAEVIGFLSGLIEGGKL